VPSNLPPPPPRPRRVVQFSFTKDELSYLVVDRVTSIRIIAPKRPKEMNDWNAYGSAVWIVRVAMGADVIEQHFTARSYMDDGTAFDPYQAFQMAREDAIVFTRELSEKINQR
jgi:hypothetical protein